MQPQLIAGRYQVVRAIGRGGMGTVWLCRDEILGREVAVKQIGALPGESAPETKRAMREARSAAALNHPNAVAVYDVVDHDGRPWLVMEYVEGQTLADEISRDGRLSPQRVADIGAQLAGALARAHERRIVHRDIKPGNVLIDRAGRPKISDFGIARGHGDDQLTATGFVTGTPGYLSPELACGADPASASDVWALGATLYSAVEGQPPYEPRSNPIALLRAIASERPRPMTHAGVLEPAIDAMLHEDPALRWDMATIAKRLGRIARVDATTVIPLVPPAATQVIAESPDEPTERHQMTQRLEAAPAAATAMAAINVPDPVVASPVVPDPIAPSPVVPRSGSPVPPDDRRDGGRGRRRWLPLAVVALLVTALGGAYLLNIVGDQGGTTSVRGATTPATAPATGGSQTSEPSPTSAAPRTTAAPDPDADNRLQSFLTSYYSDVTDDRDRTWDRLTPRMQAAAGGRKGYEGFWKTIDNVRINQIRTDAAANSAVVNLTYTRDKGGRSTETHTFAFVTIGGTYLIDSEQR
jgi:eukaryotic-like serine/threonine-protein kinase